MKKQPHILWLVAAGFLTLTQSSLPGCAQEVGAPKPVETTAKASPSAKWESDIAKFEESDKKTPPPSDAALFIGSSSIRRWTTLAQDISEIPTIRRGFGGSLLSDSVYFTNRIVLPYKPRIVVVYAGSNDLAAGQKPEAVLQQFEALVGKIHAALPDTRIAFISVNPSIKREAGLPDVRATNALIENYVKGKSHLRFINSYDGLLAANGRADGSLLVEDGLHLNDRGYKRWVSLVKPAILALYQEAAPKK